MVEILNKKVILWDFDGVIIDSMDIRARGFQDVLNLYPKNQVEELIHYHFKNGGLSRYVKFRYFFERIRKEKAEETVIDSLAKEYSGIMVKLLNSKNLLKEDVVTFIKNNYQSIKMHLVSGSDGRELRFLCNGLGIQEYFLTIEGSPQPKTELVEMIIQRFQYAMQEVCLVGDSINDLEAAEDNKIDFYGFNNKDLKGKGTGYIETLK